MASEETERQQRLVAMGEIAAEIAHELRNELQVISANAYLARQSPAESSAILAKIERHARLAHAIVDDLMALARGEALRAEPTLLADVVAAARADMTAGCANWADTIEPFDLRARLHPGLAARLLHVLYENAVHACAPRAPNIRTRAWREEVSVVIEVADDGPGVPAEILPTLFDPLVTGRAGGTGLGLALARRIAAAHGGDIAHVSSDGGAKFQLRVPEAGGRE